MTEKTGEYKYRVSVSSETSERLGKDISDKNYGKGTAIERMNARKTFANVSVGFDSQEEYIEGLKVMDSDEFLEALQKHVTTTQSVCKFAFKNDMIVTIELPENPYAVEKDPSLVQPPPTVQPPAGASGQSEFPATTQSAPNAPAPTGAIADILIAQNFRVSEQKKPKHIKQKFFRSIEDDNRNRTGYVNVEEHTDGTWKISRYMLAEKKSIPFDLTWPEEYQDLIRHIDEIVASKKLGF